MLKRSFLKLNSYKKLFLELALNANIKLIGHLFCVCVFITFPSGICRR